MVFLKVNIIKNNVLRKIDGMPLNNELKRENMGRLCYYWGGAINRKFTAR